MEFVRARYLGKTYSRGGFVMDFNDIGILHGG